MPVLASVEATLRAMWPDLPMPLTTTRRLAVDQLDRGGEALIDALDQRAHRVGLDLEHPPRELQRARIARVSPPLRAAFIMRGV